ncbi:putative HVA22-like protein g isoform X1 [Zingiber officinale]|uniref:putative HVA22-like protein g isoform X1 n=1 Tax=Zingiber officinale TaxID=94328 RepID=UPI001C4D594B|nr:putative HVA22-like protein g isoform X1 [Zingiber officinale]XP_042382075.1 putative HVA22-like protein g isoform X1 [Zingiber officinale]
MIGSLVNRSLALILGYAYPAYECFKIVELNKPDIEQLLFWCQYWILVAVLTVLERVGDNFISWIPMYGEAKLAFFVYLWCPRTKGTTYIYETFFRPYMSKHEKEIDQNLLELRTRVGDFAILYVHKVANYGQTRFFEILQYATSQSASQPSKARPVERSQTEKIALGQALSQQIPRTKSTSASAGEPAEQAKQPSRVSSSPTRIQRQEPVKTDIPHPSEATAKVPSSLSQSNTETTTLQVAIGEKETQQVAIAKQNGNEKEKQDHSPVEETPIEGAIRVTRARLRNRAATSGSSAC